MERPADRPAGQLAKEGSDPGAEAGGLIRGRVGSDGQAGGLQEAQQHTPIRSAGVRSRHWPLI